MLKWLPLSLAVLIYCSILILSVITSGNFYFEAVALLMPYWIALSALLLGGVFLLSRKFKGVRLAVVMLFVTLSLMLSRFGSFALVSLPQGGGNYELKVAFLNKLYSNTNYPEISSKIDSLQPDIIGFSEMKRLDETQILALKDYKYSYSRDSRDGATVAVFSKVPFQIDQSALSYPYVVPLKMQINNQSFEVLVIHPLPPSTPGWVKFRNEELASLARYINSLHNPHVVLMGDFNTTPYSAIFSQLLYSLSGFKDTAEGQGLNFTWHGNFIQTQIDHILVPQTSLIDSFRVLEVKGSDHNLIFAQLKV